MRVPWSLKSLLVAVAAFSLASSSVSVAHAERPARVPISAPLGSTTEQPTTRLVYIVPGCERCKISVFGFDEEGGGWGTAAMDVEDGRLEVVVPTALTNGLVTLIQPPWDDESDIVGGIPTVVMRYSKQRVGGAMTVARARSKSRASGCWAGTDAPRHRFTIVVRRARSGDDSLSSTLAFVTQTQAWKSPMKPAPGGELRTNIAVPCGGIAFRAQGSAHRIAGSPSVA